MTRNWSAGPPSRRWSSYGYTVLLAEDGPAGAGCIGGAVRPDRPRASGSDHARDGREETFHRLRAIRPDIGSFLTSGYRRVAGSTRIPGRREAPAFLQKPYTGETLTEKVRVDPEKPRGCGLRHLFRLAFERALTKRLLPQADRIGVGELYGK